MKISKANAEHYTWKDVCDGWHLVKKDELSIITESMPQNMAEDMHCHRYAFQFFYILSGEATMIFEDKQVILKTDEGIEIEKGVWHQMANNSKEPLNFLVISSPKSHGDRILKNEAD